MVWVSGLFSVFDLMRFCGVRLSRRLGFKLMMLWLGVFGSYLVYGGLVWMFTFGLGGLLCGDLWG